MAELIAIRTFLDIPTAELARSMLESAGIFAQIFSDNEGGLNPSLGFGTGSRLMIREDDVEEAEEILKDF